MSERLSPEAAEELFFGIEITRRCNLHCAHCFTSSGGPAHPGPPRASVERVLSELAAAGIRSVAFSGGEPLLRKDLPALIRHGRAAGIEKFGLVSNGFFVDRTSARELVEAGLGSAQISLDGVDAADHCAIRGCEPRDFYRALRAVRIFRDLGIPVSVATLLAPRNLRRAAEMALFCEALGVRCLRYCAFVPTGRAATPEVRLQYELQPDALDRFVLLLRTLTAQGRGHLQVVVDHAFGPWVASGEFRCISGRGIAYMSAEGDLYPCTGLLFEAFKVGNVFETPVAELLAHPALGAVRCLEKRDLRGPCGECAHQACSGGCRGAAYARTGDVRGPVSYCSARRCP